MHVRCRGHVAPLAPLGPTNLIVTARAKQVLVVLVPGNVADHAAVTAEGLQLGSTIGRQAGRQAGKRTGRHRHTRRPAGRHSSARYETSQMLSKSANTAIEVTDHHRTDRNPQLETTLPLFP